MKRRQLRARRGAVTVLMACMFIMMLAVVAFSIDLGYLYNARSELQRATDSAAMAGAWELIPNNAQLANPSLATDMTAVRDSAVGYAALNTVCQVGPNLNRNNSNSPSGELVIGELLDPYDASAGMSLLDPSHYNAVQVRLVRTAAHNGMVPLFFARIFGTQGKEMQANATAALVTQIGGFALPGSSSANVELLPFALDIQTWNGMLAGGGTDQWKWDTSTNPPTIKAGSDGIREINLYPQGTGSPGNRGTVDIGPSNNSTSDIARQILEGVSAEDLAHFGGELKFDDNGELGLNGDTGISAGVKDELAAIKGQPRIIPIFNAVAGPGNNAQYTIVLFAGIRIMSVKLTGAMSGKQVIVQPAPVIARGAVASEGAATTSYFVYSPVRLVD